MTSASLKGKFLVSRYNLPDPNFRETVVFLLEHNQEGAFGLVTNKPLEFTIQEAIPELTGVRAHQQKILLGGPVQKEVVLALHDGNGYEGGISIIPGVFFETSFDKLFPFFNDVESPVRILTFMGYSGWGPGQLERELTEDTWITLPASQDLIFLDDPSQGWRRALKAKGGLYRVFAETTNNPDLN